MFTLSPLPFAKSALEPHISAKTLEFHYGKHHQAYIDNLNKLITGTELEVATLEDIILKTAGSATQAGIFNNAAQAYNHNFFWNSLRPADATLEPPPELLTALIASFGSLDNFFNEFKTAAGGQFGSGWVWLVKSDDASGQGSAPALKIIKTANADTPIAHRVKPLLVVDVWEHAYYLDYQNRRIDFVEAILRNLLNWQFAVSNL